MKRLLWVLGIVDLVWVETYSYVLLRIVHNSPYGKYVYGHTHMCISKLLPDGKLSGESYMHSWKPFNGGGRGKI